MIASRLCTTMLSLPLGGKAYLARAVNDVGKEPKQGNQEDKANDAGCNDAFHGGDGQSSAICMPKKKFRILTAWRIQAWRRARFYSKEAVRGTLHACKRVPA